MTTSQLTADEMLQAIREAAKAMEATELPLLAEKKEKNVDIAAHGW